VKTRRSKRAAKDSGSGVAFAGDEGGLDRELAVKASDHQAGAGGVEIEVPAAAEGGVGNVEIGRRGGRGGGGDEFMN